jgi:tetratricopeptide (TPR) repeat protein
LLHRLDRDVAKRHAVFTDVFNSIRKAFPRQSPVGVPVNDQWHIYEKYLAHVIHLSNVVRESDPAIRPAIEFTELLSDGGNYMWERNLTREAQPMLQLAESICDDLLDDDDPSRIRADLIDVIGSFELDAGISSRSSGLRRKERVLKLRRKNVEKLGSEARPESFIQLSNALNNVACGYFHFQRFSDAHPLLRESLELKTRWSSVEKLPYEFAESYKNLALVWLAAGEHIKAIELAEKSVRLVDNALGQDNSSFQFFKFIQACIMFCCGELSTALTMHREILESRVQILGITHSDTWTSYFMVGAIQFYAGDYVNAE